MCYGNEAVAHNISKKQSGVRQINPAPGHIAELSLILANNRINPPSILVNRICPVRNQARPPVCIIVTV